MRRSLESLMGKVSLLEIPPEDKVAREKQNRMKTHLEGLIEETGLKDNYQFNWIFNWAGVIVGFIAACVVFLLVMALR